MEPTGSQGIQSGELNRSRQSPKRKEGGMVERPIGVRNEGGVDLLESPMIKTITMISMTKGYKWKGGI